MTERFSNRVVVVTGAAGGLGRELAVGFGREGARLVLADIDTSGLEESARLLREQDITCDMQVVDLADESSIREFGANICQRSARVDVLLNNAGIAYGDITHGFENLSQQQWLRFLAVNTVAPLLVAQALRQGLAEARGVVINQTSMASFSPGTAYGVTKSALNAMTYGMAHAFGQDGIRVNAVAPGLMETPAAKQGLPGDTFSRVRATQLLDLAGSPQDIVNLTLFLASDEARFINCEVMSCDAGSRVRQWRY